MGLHILFRKRHPLSLDPPLRWGTLPLMGKMEETSGRTVWSVPFWRGLQCWVQSPVFCWFGPQGTCVSPPSSLPLPGWQPGQGASCSSGSSPLAHWFSTPPTPYSFVKNSQHVSQWKLFTWIIHVNIVITSILPFCLIPSKSSLHILYEPGQTWM